MAYFKKFKDIVYGLNVSDEFTLHVLKDISTNFRIKDYIKEAIQLAEVYRVPDGESWDSLSAKLYQTTRFHWILMLLNDRIDYRNSLPLSEIDLMKLVTDKYGSANVHKQHVLYGVLHYRDRKGNIVNVLTEDEFNIATPYRSVEEYNQANPNNVIDEKYFRVLYPYLDYSVYVNQFQPISNFDYESELNESKREVLVVHPEVAQRIEQDLFRLLDE